MKKILFLLAAASLTLTSCLKEDENYKQFLLVAPGVNIYNGAMTQQNIAMQPLDQVMRLAVLLSEGDLQQKAIDELPSMMVSYEEGGQTKKINVFDKMFRDKTTISKTAEGNYTIELAPETTGFYTGVGTLTVNTSGVPLLQDTDSSNPWTVFLPSGFKIRVASNNAPSGYQEVNLEGAFMVYKNGLFYQIQLSGMKAYMQSSSTIASNWGGVFELTPPTGGESLAFSACMGKKFGFDGIASGPTCVTYNGITGAEMFYSITDGLYLNSSQCINGTEKAKLTGYGDYEAADFPSAEVEVEWKLGEDGKTLSQIVKYNGYSMTF